MELLTIDHKDFTMYGECAKFDCIRDKARNSVGEENLMSAYTWTEGVVSVRKGDVLLNCGEKAPAVFFDNTEYPVWVYYTGPQFPSTIALHNIHFFIPYFKDKGIRDVYEITGIRTIKGSEAKQTEGADANTDELRLAFHLRYSRRLSADFQKIDTSRMVNYSFIDTTFSCIEKLKTDNI